MYVKALLYNISTYTSNCLAAVVKIEYGNLIICICHTVPTVSILYHDVTETVNPEVNKFTELPEEV